MYTVRQSVRWPSQTIPTRDAKPPTHCIHMKLCHTCQVGKVQKREIFASCQRGRFCVKPFRDINFVYQHSNSSLKFENDDILPPYNGLKPHYMMHISFHLYCSLRILCWLSNVFSLQNSIRFTLFKEKMIGRKWGSKRGRFPFLGGRWGQKEGVSLL